MFFLLEVSAQNCPASRGEEQFYAKTQTTQRRSFCEETQTCHGDTLLTCNPYGSAMIFLTQLGN